MSTFESLRGGDLISFRVRSGTTSRRGKIVAEWATRRARVNPLLCFADHVVANYTSSGTVVDRHNFISLIIE